MTHDRGLPQKAPHRRRTRVKSLDASSERDFPAKRRLSILTVPAVVCGNRWDLEGRGREPVTRKWGQEIIGETCRSSKPRPKDGSGLDGLFRALATLGGLPDETGPSRHPRSYHPRLPVAVHQPARQEESRTPRDSARPAPPWTPGATPGFTPATCGWCLDQAPTQQTEVSGSVVVGLLDKPIIVVCNVSYMRSYL
ncbi:dexamethasone-induced Ras-related protein 1-like protein [Lates japonicus]|uniref:Dexamethasone-induced Ras-related protein 1-like protein n=1 Tax=Lates japonicus TaxID=270547 RepID=A0AAD3QZF6_LATJO|nr:dexamethasone-induced Ras-related protein 1-like protein [Lates japonicus]